METNALPQNSTIAVDQNVDFAARTQVEPLIVRLELPQYGSCWLPAPWRRLPPEQMPRPVPAPESKGPQTVEDKIQELLCKIMAKMDDKIEAHAKQIEALQEGNSSTTGANSSVDIETMKLKHEIDQRTSMFDMLRSIMDKYEQTTSSVVHSMDR